MNQFHIVMNGKGGIGKSIVAYNLAQYLKANDPDTLCIDTDPLTPTLSKYRALEARHLQIASDSEIILNRFDEMIEEIVSTSHDAVIDTGASTFIPIANYLAKNKVFQFLKDEYGKDIFLHVVLNAQTQNDYLSTLASLEMLTTTFAANVKIVIWLNEFGGSLANFTKSQFYLDNESLVFGMIRIKNPDELLLHDFKAILQNYQTYHEALGDSKLFVMSRSRIKRMRDEIYGQIGSVVV